MESFDLGTLVMAIIGMLSLAVNIIQTCNLFRKNPKYEFFSFKSRREQNNSTFLKWITFISGSVIISLALFIFIFSELDQIPGFENRKLTQIIVFIVITMACFVNTLLNQIWVYKSIKRVDKWIEKDEVKTIIENSLGLSIILFLVILVVVLFFHIDFFGEIGTMLIAYLIIGCVFSVFISFVYMYYTLRALYAVISTKIYLKGDIREYHDALDFRYRGNVCTFLCLDEDLKRIQTDKDNVLSIEQTLDTEINLKSCYLLAKERIAETK